MSVRDWKGTAKMTVKKLGEIIGTTTDTGGTATAGTLMAKVNAILNTVVNGVKVSGEVTIKETAQTKKFTEFVLSHGLRGEKYSITGTGRATILCTNSSGEVGITVDGVEQTFKMNLDYVNTLVFYFEESLVVDVPDTAIMVRVFVQS